jgi:AraC-like DNA-binding protein
MTLTEFITKEKIKEAKRLLQFTSKSLEAISDYLAFSSQSHFSRVFKNYEKCTPGEYRRRVPYSS